MTNSELYTKTKTEEWSTTIQRRRLNWLGHLMILHSETPARLALAEYLRKVLHTVPGLVLITHGKHCYKVIHKLLCYN